MSTRKQLCIPKTNSGWISINSEYLWLFFFCTHKAIPLSRQLSLSSRSAVFLHQTLDGLLLQFPQQDVDLRDRLGRIGQDIRVCHGSRFAQQLIHLQRNCVPFKPFDILQPTRNYFLLSVFKSTTLTSSALARSSEVELWGCWRSVKLGSGIFISRDWGRTLDISRCDWRDSSTSTKVICCLQTALHQILRN